MLVSSVLAPPESTAGTLARLKNQTETPDAASSVTHTPPPACAKAAPKEAVDGFVTVQPELELAR